MDIFLLSSGNLFLINPFFFVQLQVDVKPELKFVVSKRFSWKFEKGKLIREEKIDDDQIFFDLHLQDLDQQPDVSQPIINLQGENEPGIEDCIIKGRVTELNKRLQVQRLLKEHLRPSPWKNIVLDLLS
jgi:hypothetical protein